MGFGTAKYDAYLWSSRFAKPRKNNKKKGGAFGRNQPTTTTNGAKQEKQEPSGARSDEGAVFPALPEGWVKRENTATGDASYDQTTREIKSQLKRTMVRK